LKMGLDPSPPPLSSPPCIQCQSQIESRTSLSAKEPLISGSFAERDLQLEASYASSPPCIQCQSQIESCTSLSAKEPLIRALVRKMTPKDKESYGSSPPCNTPKCCRGIGCTFLALFSSFFPRSLSLSRARSLATPAGVLSRMVGRRLKHTIREIPKSQFAAHHAV